MRAHSSLHNEKDILVCNWKQESLGSYALQKIAGTITNHCACTRPHSLQTALLKEIETKKQLATDIQKSLPDFPQGIDF